MHPNPTKLVFFTMLTLIFVFSGEVMWKLEAANQYESLFYPVMTLTNIASLGASAFMLLELWNDARKKGKLGSTLQEPKH